MLSNIANRMFAQLTTAKAAGNGSCCDFEPLLEEKEKTSMTITRRKEEKEKTFGRGLLKGMLWVLTIT